MVDMAVTVVVEVETVMGEMAEMEVTDFWWVMEGTEDTDETVVRVEKVEMAVYLGKTEKNGNDGKLERRKIRAIERLLKSLEHDSPFAKRTFIPKFNISNEIQEGQITRQEFSNILKRPDLEKILFRKIDADSNQAITCQEIKARKLLHIVEGC